MTPPTISLPNELDAEDFRRLGVRPNEMRLPVIRQAASRSAHALAAKQLASPSPDGRLQLSRVLTSTYRLMDPRLRQDSHHRAFIGRILPNTLSHAGRTQFHIDTSTPAPQKTSTPFQPSASDESDWIDIVDFDSIRVDEDNESSELNWLVSLSDTDLLETTPMRRRLTRVRRRMFLPGVLIASIGLTAGTMLGVWTLNQRFQESHSWQMAAADTAVPTPTSSTPAAVADPESAGLSTTPKLGAAGSKMADPELAETPTSRTPSKNAGEAEPVSAGPVVSSDQFAPDPFVAAGLDGSMSGLASSADSTSADSMPGDVSDVEHVVGPMPGQSYEQADAPELSIPVEFDPTMISTLVPNNEPGLVPSAPTALDPWRGFWSDARAIVDQLSMDSSSVPSVVVGYAMPPQAEIQAALARLETLVPELAANPVVDVPSLIVRLDAIAETLVVGSADHWATRLTAVRLTWWSSDDPHAIRQRLDSLVADYRVDAPLLWSATYAAAWRTGAVQKPDALPRMFALALPLCEFLLTQEAFDGCIDVATAVLNVAGKVTSPDQLPPVAINRGMRSMLVDYQESAVQMKRLAVTVNQTIESSGGLDLVSARDAEAGTFGRYFALMKRRWDPTTLGWLGAMSDVRLAGLARQESVILLDASPDDLATLAARWWTASDRLSGRSLDSVRLHSIDLLTEAVRQSDGLKELQWQRTLDEHLDLIPPHLQRPLLASPPETETQETSDDPAAQPIGMVGRILSTDDEGTDFGIQLNYQTGVPITPSMIRQIGERRGRDIQDFRVELLGDLRLDQPQTVRITLSPAGLASTIQESVTVGDRSLVFDPLDRVVELALPAGVHRLVWTLSGATWDARFLIAVDDADTGQAIGLTPPSDRSSAAATDTVVNFQRGS